MSPLPPVDPELNRQLIAERLGWPDGALAECTALEGDYPRWLVFWTKGGLPWTPDAGYRAILNWHRHRGELYAPTAAELRDVLEAADAEVPGPDDWPTRITALVDRG